MLIHDRDCFRAKEQSPQVFLDVGFMIGILNMWKETGTVLQSIQGRKMLNEKARQLTLA